MYVSTGPRRFVTFYISALEIFLLTYLFTYQRYQPHRPKVRLRTWFSSADGEDKDGGAATISGSGLVKRGGRRAEDRKDRRRCRMQT